MPSLVDFLENAKAQRIEDERLNRIRIGQRILIQLLKDYAPTRPIDEIIPVAADVYNMEEFKDIIENAEVEVTPEMFAEVMTELPQLSKDWRASKGRELLALMNQVDIPASSEDSDTAAVEDVHSRLQLATTYFKCLSCPKYPIRYPLILEHRCLTEFDYDPPFPSGEIGLYESLKSIPWNYDNRVMIHEDAHHAARAVVEACGFDPDVTTSREMDEMNPVVECLRCSNTARRRGRRWQGAVRFLRHNLGLITHCKSGRALCLRPLGPDVCSLAGPHRG